MLFCVRFSQAFGVDDGRIVPIVAVMGIAFASLFSTWSNSQANDEFFEYVKPQNPSSLDWEL